MASRSLNKVTLVGNLTRDPELKYTPTGAAVCTIGIATNRSWNTTDGQTKEEVQYHRVVAWNKLAELCGKLLNKGRKVYLEGRLAYRSYVGKDGIQRSITEIILDDFIVFGDGKKSFTPEGAKEPVTGPAKEATETEDIPAPVESSSSSKDESVNPDDIPF
jgi:single-strand DNA-binding protein